MVHDESRKLPEVTFQSRGHGRFVSQWSLRMECEREVSELQPYLRGISLDQLVQHVHGGTSHGTLQVCKELESHRSLCRPFAPQLARDFSAGLRSPLFAPYELFQLI